MTEKKKTQDKETKRRASRKTEVVPPGMREKRESEKIRCNGLIRAFCLMVFLVLTGIGVTADVLPGEESGKIPLVIVLRPEKTEGEEDPDLAHTIRTQIEEQVGEGKEELTDRLCACVSWTYEYSDEVIPPGTDRMAGESEIYLTFAEDPEYTFVGWTDSEGTYAGEEDRISEEDTTSQRADPEDWGDAEYTAPEDWGDAEYAAPEDWEDAEYTAPEDWENAEYTDPEETDGESVEPDREDDGEESAESDEYRQEEDAEREEDSTEQGLGSEFRSFLTTWPREEEAPVEEESDEETTVLGEEMSDEEKPVFGEETSSAEKEDVEEAAAERHETVEDTVEVQIDDAWVEAETPEEVVDEEDGTEPDLSPEEEILEEEVPEEEIPEDAEFWEAEETGASGFSEAEWPADDRYGPPVVAEGFRELIRSWTPGAGASAAETAESTEEADDTETAADRSPTTVVQLLRTGSGNREEDITAAYREALAGIDPGRINWETVLAPLPENDGTYVLRKTEIDSEGNSAVEETVFSVNRFGSIYTYNDALQSLRGKVVKSVDRPLVVSEYNPDSLEDDSWKITLSLDGKPIDTVLYTVRRSEEETRPSGTEEGERKAGDSAGTAVLTAMRASSPVSQRWSRYDYVISPDNFRGDGVYSLSVSSRDTAGNTPEMHRYNGGEITFTVDGSPPELQMVRGLEKPVVTARKAEVHVTAFDTVGLARLSAFVDGKCMATEDRFSDRHRAELVFSISGGVAQNVRILAEDTAGNVLDTDERTADKAYAFRPAFPFFRQITVHPPGAEAPPFRGLSVLLLMIVVCTAVSGGLLWYVFRNDRRKTARQDRNPDID